CRKGENPFSSDRKVKIVNYRGRFAEVREVNRTVSDDPTVVQEIKLYFYDLRKHENEEGKIELVYVTQLDSPRDAVSTPSWSLDSNHVTFADFHFNDENVAIYTASFPVDKSVDVKAKSKQASPDSKSKSKNEDRKSDDEKPGDESSADKKEGEESQSPPGLAKLQYRFLHFGGPNTPRLIRPQFLAASDKILFVGEQSGFRHLHILDTVYQTVSPLTEGNFEVYFEGLSEDRKIVFATSTKNSPARNMPFRIAIEDKKMEPLSDVQGTYSTVAISQDGTKALGNYVTFGKLRELVRIDQGRKDSFRVLTDSHSDRAREVTKPVPEFLTYQNRHGQMLHATLFKPAGWKKTDKRPCLIYVYGGPLGTRHSVVDGSYSSDSYYFAYYMAEKHGYVTMTIDPRGQSGYGALFEKSNFKQVGKPQVEDLVDGVKYAVANYGVDGKRVGLHGWSFGGFQTQMCLYTEPDVFAAGIAGAGPTEWENYNKWYSTGTIDRSAAGKPEQQKYSLLPLAKNLKSKLLLVHGMEDSNVLYQDTVRVYRELIKAGKETLVELFLDPTGGHGLGGDIKRLAKYRKYEEFLTRVLGTSKVGK
ncbi:MAG: prolyl oligopeptidase family serine peptidase, partial [Pirellulaceae bacterium]|nr:prolyl oligopeptidase family serine peptidase [Pirellulaceae bacterium]